MWAPAFAGATIFALLLLQGCSSMRLAYDNADAWARWRANAYFDPQGEAGDELDRRIAAFHAWHRAKMLPQVAQLAEDTAKRIEQGLTRADIERVYAALEAHIRASVREGATQVAGLLDRLEPAQLAYFENKLAEENRKFARENLEGGEEKHRKRRLKRTVERLEDWVGPLSEEQARRVQRYNDRAPMLSELRDRDRKRLQAELVSMLRAREAAKRLPEWAAHWDRNREPNYSSAFREARAAYTDLLLELYPTLSAEQKRSAASRMRGLAADFEHLARR
jgi:hypothetical protein